MSIPTQMKGKSLERFVRDLRKHRASYTANDYSYANDVLKISLNTYKKHAYPHKSGIVVCDVLVMQEDEHGKTQQRFVA